MVNELIRDKIMVPIPVQRHIQSPVKHLTCSALRK